jgi:hypothetical protein
MKYLLVLFLCLTGCATTTYGEYRLFEKACEAGYVLAVVDYKELIPKDERQKIKDQKLYERRCREEIVKVRR